MNLWTGNAGQWVECWPSSHGALGLIPRLHKPGMETRDCNPSTREVEAGGSDAQLHNELRLA